MGNDPRHEPPENPGRPHPKRRRTRGRAGAATPVVRLDIYASSEGRGATPASAAPEAGPEHADLDRRKAELDGRKAELDQRKTELDELARRLAEQREQTSIAERRLKSSIAQL